MGLTSSKARKKSSKGLLDSEAEPLISPEVEVTAKPSKREAKGGYTELHSEAVEDLREQRTLFIEARGFFRLDLKDSNTDIVQISEIIERAQEKIDEVDEITSFSSGLDEIGEDKIPGRLEFEFEKGDIAYVKGSVQLDAVAKIEKVAKILRDETSIGFDSYGKVELGAKVDGHIEAALGEYAHLKQDVVGFIGAVGTARGTTQIGWEGVFADISANIFAGLSATSTTEGILGSADNNASLKAELIAAAGVQADVNLGIQATFQQFSAAAKVSGFAGARGTARTTATLKIFGRELIQQQYTVVATAGIGGEASASVDFGIDKIGFDFGTELTYGIGTGASMQTTVKPIECFIAYKKARDLISDYSSYKKGYSRMDHDPALIEAKFRYQEMYKYIDDKIKKLDKEIKRRGG